jgi:putative membrane protein
MRSEPRALHPATVLLGMPIALIVRSVVLPGAALFASGFADVLPILVLVLVFAVSRVLAWQRFRFSFDGEVVRVASGVLQRTHRSVDVARVQQVEIDRPLAQRLLGVATLRIETAGADDEPEVELRVLTEADAVALRDEVLAGRDRARGRAGDAALTGSGALAGGAALTGGGAQPVLALSAGRVALAAITGAQLLVAPALVVGALQLTELRLDVLVIDAVARVSALSSALGGALVAGVTALVALVVMVLTTLVAGVVRDGRFHIERVGEDLVIRRGLLGTRESIVPLQRVQVVRVVANPLRRALGMAAVRIHSASASGGGERRRVVVPLVAQHELTALLTALLPSDVAPPPTARHPRAAVRRAVVRRTIPLLQLGAALAVVLGWLGTARLETLVGAAVRGVVRATVPAAVPLGPLAVALVTVLVVTVLALGVAEGRALAHGIDARLLVVRHGALMRTRSLVPLERLQAVTLRASWFQRRLGLASLVAHVAGPGGDVWVLDAAHDDARSLRIALAAAAAGDGSHALAQR